MMDDAKKTGIKLLQGQTFPFFPIPVIEHNLEWFDAGPVSFAVEVRVLDEAKHGMVAGGGSLHVFSPDHKRELVRFDCFDMLPHYHYIHHADRSNTAWTYDEPMNGPMLRWALSAIRRNLASMVRQSGASDVADAIERDGWDVAVLDRVEHAVLQAGARAASDESLVEEGTEWRLKWRDEMRQNARGS